MRGYGNCAPHCLGWQSSAPVQGSPSHHCTQWAGVLPVAMWCPQALLASPCWIWSSSQLQGEEKSQRPLCSSQGPCSGGSELGCGVVPSRWDAGWYWWHQWHNSWVSHTLVFG